MGQSETSKIPEGPHHRDHAGPSPADALPGVGGALGMGQSETSGQTFDASDRMSLWLDFKWDTPVTIEREMVERLCGNLAGRAENFLVIEGMNTYQSGLDDVTVDARRIE